MGYGVLYYIDNDTTDSIAMVAHGVLSRTPSQTPQTPTQSLLSTPQAQRGISDRRTALLSETLRDFGDAALRH